MAMISTCLLQSQNPIPSKFYKGYQRSVKGGNFQYHSPQPDVTTSLLIRSIDTVQHIEWETEAVPVHEHSDFVKFIWMFGIDANTDSHKFRLSFNGRNILTFSNPVTTSSESWKIPGADGSELLFHPVLIDKYGDPMGYAILSIPNSLIVNGKSQVIRITGEAAESRSWYMTFEAGVEEKISVVQVPAVLRGKTENYLQLLFGIIHLGDMTTGTIEIPGIIPGKKTIELGTGFTEIPVMIPEKTLPGPKTAIVTIAKNSPQIINFSIASFRHFNIYLVQHTHTDIGYTRPQTEILPDHMRYIDYALDYCDLTDSLPDDARFRWTCETTWAVREYLKTRPEKQITRLKKRVEEGRIEVAGLFLNGSDLSDETTIAAMLEPVGYLRQSGLQVRSAMQSDINGVPWCLTDYLPGASIQYLNMAQNTHRAHKPFDRPTVFWWESPSGSRLMVNRPEHYMWANSLGIISRLSTFETGLFRHLQDLEKRGYPYDRYAIQFSGYLTDNAPPSTTACSVVDEWNKKYIWPKLRLATLSEFMDYMKQEHSDDLPVVRGAWPDWWMDGFGSAAIQTAYARNAHSDYIANLGLQSIAALLGVPANTAITELQSQVTDDLAFYDEHTFGAAESITDPLCENSVVQLGQKESYVWSAVKKNRILREQVMGRIQPFLPRTGMPTLTVFNTLGNSRSGNVMVYIDHQLLPRDRAFSLIDLGEKAMPMQAVSTREEGTWWIANLDHVPPLGYNTYRILVEKKTRSIDTLSPAGRNFENKHYRIELDPATGTITDIFDKNWNRSLVDRQAPNRIGEVIYERLGKNRAQLEQYRLDEVTRSSWKNLKFMGTTSGPVFDVLFWEGNLENCAQGAVKCEIRLYHSEKKIEFCYSMKKLPVTDPEAVYVAFPFLLPEGRFEAQVAGGTMIPGVGQIEGSASDWLGIQDYLSLKNADGQIVFVSPEIPLVQPGAINTGNFKRIANPQTGHIFSWVLNNYWTTNFLASQEGELRWRYCITSGASLTNTDAVRFGMENRVSMIPRVLPAGTTADTLQWYSSFFRNCDKGVQMVSCKPVKDGNTIRILFRETSGQNDSIPIYDLTLSSIPLADAMHARAISEVNAIGEPLGKVWDSKNTLHLIGNRKWLLFRPYEPKFIEVEIVNK